MNNQKVAPLELYLTKNTVSTNSSLLKEQF